MRLRTPPARLAGYDTTGKRTAQEHRDDSRAGGRIGGRACGDRAAAYNAGIGQQSPEERAECGRAGGKSAYEQGVGVHGLSKEERADNSRAGGRIGGRAGGHGMKTADFMEAMATPPQGTAADRCERLLSRLRPLRSVTFVGSAFMHVEGWTLCDETWPAPLFAAAALLRERLERGEVTLAWASATALRGAGYALQAIVAPQRLIQLVARAAEMTPDTAAHFRLGAAAAQLRKERTLDLALRTLSMEESTGSCPMPPPSAGGGSSPSGSPTPSGGSPSDAASGVGPVPPNEADEESDGEGDDDLYSGASDCSGSVGRTLALVFATAVRCLDELQKAADAGVAIRPVELQAAILARCSHYSTPATAATAACTAEHFAAAHAAMQQVGLELRRLGRRRAEDILLADSLYDF